VARHHRSHEELRWFAPHADLLMVFDNSAPAAAPILLASRGKGRPLAYHAEGVAYHAAGVNPVVGRARQDMAAKHTFTHG
jgi:hypothetical protein